MSVDGLATEVQDRVVAWMQDGASWVTPRAPKEGLHAMVLADDYHALLIEYAALVAEIEAAPVAEVKRGLTGKGLIVCETDLEPGRVRLLAEDNGGDGG